MQIERLIKILLIIIIGLLQAPAYAVPNVVASIAPIHSLVSMVMEGVSEPSLLIKSAQSPHSASLVPSVHKKIIDADLIFWLGSEFETSLAKPISALAGPTQVVSLMTQPTIMRLMNRDSRRFDAVELHGGDDHEKNMVDPHIWLSADNAVSMVKIISQILIEIDPQNRKQYLENTKKYSYKIQSVKQQTLKQLEHIKNVNYFVFHDAYQYYEHEFGLHFVGAFTNAPERKLGLKSVLNAKQSIEQNKVECLFYEPQFKPKLIVQIAKQTGVPISELDPVGLTLKPGVKQWFTLINNLSNTLVSCGR